jgi:hypothetical protein
MEMKWDLVNKFQESSCGEPGGLLSKVLVSTLIFCLSNVQLKAQDFSEYIRKNAVSTDSMYFKSDAVYSFLKSYKLIMIGEMHGTNEPAALTIEFSGMLTDRGDSVQVGLEIPSELMAKFTAGKTDTSISQSEFFANHFEDGRGSYAWVEIIKQVSKNPKARIFFYDVNQDEYKTTSSRDSLLYIHVKKEMNAFPNWKTITLSGNVHNMIIPINGKVKMGLYLMRDSSLNLIGETISINHFYESGSMRNNTGKGLELRYVNYTGSEYGKSAFSNSYLLKMPENQNQHHNAIYWTRNVTAATMVEKKK